MRLAAGQLRLAGVAFPGLTNSQERMRRVRRRREPTIILPDCAKDGITR
jgi:hypothetical protein